MKKLVILISGRGSNMEAIIRACADEGWAAQVAAVIANRPDAAGLAFAASHGIATAVVDHRQFPDRDSFDAALAQEIDSFAPDLVVLAGFMRVLTAGFVDHYAGRMLNVHPSLLPSFPGLKTHQQALDAGVRLHGASVHFVTSQLDHGPIVAQAAVPVEAGDTPATLAERVLATEHIIYPRAVRWFVEGRLALDGLRVTLTPPEPQWLFAGSHRRRGRMRLHGFLIGQTETLLAEVLKLNGPADATTSRFFRAHPKLGHGERGVIAEAVFAVLRRRMEFAHLAEGGAGGPARRMALLGLMQTAGRTALKPFLTDTESHWLEHVAKIDPESLPLRIRLNLPDWIYQALSKRFEPAELAQLAAALNYPAPLDLRANPIKASRDDVLNALSKAGIEGGATPFAPFGVRVVGKPPLTKLDAFQHGWVEVQDEGSQLLCSLVAPKRGEMIVDFCAGAGGKTLALGAAMRSTGRLYAFDVSERRLAKLKPRLARSGLSNVNPVLIDSEHDAKIKRLAGKIDRVLVDAPCSGLGTLRRNPDLKWRQSPESVAELAPKQASILASASRLVKKGGRLVYATCSILEAENEAVVQQFLADHPDFALVPARDVLAEQRIELEMGDYLSLWPHRHATDGFFAAVLERQS